jgi:ionotropic glutamate receptor
LYAYDAVWTIAYAVSSYLKANGKFNFLSPRKMPIQSGGKSELSKLKVFETGDEFKDQILRTQFLGTSGLIRFDKAGDRIGGAFEYINIVGRNPHGVGYWWANHNSISLSPPSKSELLNLTNLQQNNGFLSQGSSSNATKMPIIWPGGVTDTPRGWALPKDGNILKIGVPRKAGYTELVSVTTDAENRTIVDGFCIQVFKSALSLLPYDVPYEFELLGDGVTTPKYSDLIQKLANQVSLLFIIIIIIFITNVIGFSIQNACQFAL